MPGFEQVTDWSSALHCIDGLRSISPHLAVNGSSLKRYRERVREKRREREGESEREALDHRPHAPHAAGPQVSFFSFGLRHNTYYKSQF